MSEGPVLAAARDLLRLGMNGDNASGLPRPHLVCRLLLESKIPTNNRASPILEHSAKGGRPLAPIHFKVRTADDGAALCPLRVLVGKSVVHSSHRVHAAAVGVPGNAVHVAVYARLAYLVQHTAPQVIVVVEN